MARELVYVSDQGNGGAGFAMNNFAGGGLFLLCMVLVSLSLVSLVVFICGDDDHKPHIGAGCRAGDGGCRDGGGKGDGGCRG